jgi:hypothetical protein
MPLTLSGEAKKPMKLTRLHRASPLSGLALGPMENFEVSIHHSRLKAILGNEGGTGFCELYPERRPPGTNSVLFTDQFPPIP